MRKSLRGPNMWCSRTWRSVLLAAAGIAVVAHSAFGLITGGEGNEPIHDPGFPAGAAILFNQPTRVAYWEGPPFGGGQYHAEFRGDAQSFNTALTYFAKVDAKVKRLVVRDGVGSSFWLNPNHELAKAGSAQIDWVFVVWEPRAWKQLLKLRVGLRANDLGNLKDGPPTQIEVYTGGQIRWADVVVPKG